MTKETMNTLKSYFNNDVDNICLIDIEYLIDEGLCKVTKPFGELFFRYSEGIPESIEEKICSSENTGIVVMCCEECHSPLMDEMVDVVHNIFAEGNKRPNAESHFDFNVTINSEKVLIRVFMFYNCCGSIRALDDAYPCIKKLVHDYSPINEDLGKRNQGVLDYIGDILIDCDLEDYDAVFIDPSELIKIIEENGQNIQIYLGEDDVSDIDDINLTYETAYRSIVYRYCMDHDIVFDHPKNMISPIFIDHLFDHYAVRIDGSLPQLIRVIQSINSFVENILDF